MRKYTGSLGEEVDLDSPKTYKHLPKTTKELDALMFKEIGYALCYMDYFHKDWYSGKRGDGQRKRVYKLIKAFTKDRKNNYTNKIWYKEQIFLFQDEIENMC